MLRAILGKHGSSSPANMRLRDAHPRPRIRTTSLAEARILFNYLEINIFYSRFIFVYLLKSVHFALTINQPSMFGSWTKIQVYGSWFQKQKKQTNKQNKAKRKKEGWPISWRILLKPQAARDKSESRFLCILNTDAIARVSITFT